MAGIAEFGETEPTVEEIEESLPEGFWTLPETFIDDEGIRQIYSSLYKKLLEENPDRDTIQLMMIQRAAALFAYMRSLEKKDGYRNSSDYRQLAALWNSMANDLRKNKIHDYSETDIRQEIMLDLMQRMNSALQGFDVQIASTVRRRVLASLERE